ncbi:MAG: hypothetical protein IANPNBLG_00868 [Bryobacteraceae bacterium]|nr:hypothetical protein [Bryobacteraceae bacterium]
MSTSPGPGTRRLVRCVVGNETYCIDNDWLDSIQVVENLYPSRSADGSIGWIRRFDEKVPVFRLADQISSAHSRGASRQGVIMVLRKGEKLWALLVDKVTAASEVELDRMCPLPAVAGDTVRGHFPGVVVEEEGIMLYLAPDRVVPPEVSGVRSPAPHAASRRASHVRVAPRRIQVGLRRAAQQIITFTLVHETPMTSPVRFGVTAGQAVEIVSELPMIAVPQAPPFVVGLAKWRSLPIPVVDLGAWLGMTPAPYTPGCRLLLCRGTISGGGRDAGLLAVPAVDDIRKLDLPIEYRPWPEPVKWNSALALGIYRAERTMLVIPDLDAVLSFRNAVSSYTM